jgi:L-threonylcarbamoyladenylate synthase
MTILPTHTPEEKQCAIRLAVKTLRLGGVIALATETTYGLACDPRNAKAVNRIFQIKGRVESKPLQLIAGTLAQVNRLAQLTKEEKCLGDTYWPGALTLLVKLRSTIKLAPRVSPRRVIGVRISSDEFVRSLANAFGHPIAATSANRSGEIPAFSGSGVIKAFTKFRAQPDLILDAGRIPRRKPSTVARVKKDGRIEILREGSIRL